MKNIFSKTQIKTLYTLGAQKLQCHYVQKLIKAKKDGVVDFKNLTLIDPYSTSPARNMFGNKINFIQRDYDAFIGEFIKAEVKDPHFYALIPDHTAPHVLFKVLIRLLKQNFKGASVKIIPFKHKWHLPFQKTYESGICAVSYAKWTCPEDCAESKICPAINNARSWNFNDIVTQYKKEHEKDGLSIHLFPCIQFAYGVVIIPMNEIVGEWNCLKKRISKNKKSEFIVATYSKCHGIIGRAEISL